MKKKIKFDLKSALIHGVTFTVVMFLLDVVLSADKSVLKYLVQGVLFGVLMSFIMPIKTKVKED